MKTQILLIFLTICLGVNAQQPVGTVFTAGSFKYVITVAGTASANSNREVAVKEYLDVNNLTPTIPSTAFYGTTYNVTSIGENAFAGSYAITSVNIPNSVITIGENAFQGNALTSVILPNTLTTLDEDAFASNSLASITIPASVTTIGTGAFRANSALLTVVSQSTNPATLLKYTFDDNSLIDLTVPNGFEQTYIDANWYGFKTVNAIDYTFTQNDIVYQIVDITNNDKVATYDYLGANTTINIPATVTNSGSNFDVITIGDASFTSNSLTSVTIPNSITTIEAAAFRNNSLTSVTIPAFVTTIGTAAFDNNYNLTTVVSESTTPATLLSYTFFNNNSGIDLTIPLNTTAAYTAAGWVNFNSVTELCNVNIPDANFKSYLLANTAINTNNDSEIQCSEATAFTGNIYVYNESIADLTGIEAFTNITYLYCASNTLTSLDLSANTALEELYCHSNSLTSLDLSANTALKKLNCDSNSLVDLNVANGNNNNFTTFIATLNPSLTCITVDNVAWSSSNWNQIDSQTSFSANCSATTGTVTIPDSNFKNYLVANTSINTNGDSEIQNSEATAFAGTINVTNKSIADLTGIEAFTSLTDLNCGLNSLTSLDVSQNTALTTLYCNNNQLTSLDVSGNTALEFLFCQQNQLPSLDVSASLALRYLRCGYNQLPSLNISVNTALETLICDGNQLSSIDVSTNVTLKKLECVNNSLTSIDVSNNVNLEDLRSAFNSISNIDVSHNTGLSYLDLSNTSLTNLDISTNSALEKLYFSNTQITSIDLSNNLGLLELNFQNSAVTSLDVSANIVLTSLICSGNDLTSLNVANGNNSNFTLFYAQNNQNLTCIQVDNVAYSTANWTNKDATASYNTNCATASVYHLTLNQVSIYPNPTTSILNIEIDSNLKRATIYSVLGAKILETSSKNIKTSNLKRGFYVIKIESENGNISTKRFMKK